MSENDSGFVYCLSNTFYQNILKIIITSNNYKIVSDDIEKVNKTLPYDFEIVFMKKINDFKNNEIKINDMIKNYIIRLDYYNLDLLKFESLFNLLNQRQVNLQTEEGTETTTRTATSQTIDNQQPLIINISNNTSNTNSIKSEINNLQVKKNKTQPRGCRNIKKCFNDGQQIRHVINKSSNNSSIWIGTYKFDTNEIIYGEHKFSGKSPLNRFISLHYQTERNDRGSNANAWIECEYLVNGKWLSIFNLPEIR
jgi:hypothetical protein